jgi:isopenicillin-N N-acyltransferase-like protein
VALNVRTEVAYGMYSDGCTALSFHSRNTAFQAQNWDWKAAQGPNLINLSIAIPGRPTIAIITEAGIIGKIGLSSAGVGVTLNAIAALGVAHGKIPVHIALRAALDWSGELDAEGIAKRLEERGVASAGHILVSDGQKGIGLEVSARDVVRVRTVQARGGTAVLHSNHYIEEHPGVKLASASSSCSRPTRVPSRRMRSRRGSVTRTAFPEVSVGTSRVTPPRSRSSASLWT